MPPSAPSNFFIFSFQNGHFFLFFLRPFESPQKSHFFHLIKLAKFGERWISVNCQLLRWKNLWKSDIAAEFWLVKSLRKGVGIFDIGEHWLVVHSRSEAVECGIVICNFLNGETFHEINHTHLHIAHVPASAGFVWFNPKALLFP
jgi:hypothetical protein